MNGHGHGNGGGYGGGGYGGGYGGGGHGGGAGGSGQGGPGGEGEGSEIPAGFVFVPAPHLRKAQEWVFVLRSVGLDGSVRMLNGGGYGILLLESQGARALENLRAYEAENRDWPPAQKRDRPLYQGSLWAAFVFAVASVFFLVTGPAATQSRWFRAGVADTDQLLHGKPWQALTALTLHSDASHIMGNAISGTIFLSAVHRRLGAGVGTFAVIAAGTAGNALNAWWHGTAHRSLGASTAVFAAIGVLAATQVLLNRTSSRGFYQTLGPVLGGLALLGTLGAGGARTDLHAHLFGFLAGLVVGALAGLPVRRRESPLPTAVQVAFGGLSVASVLGAWGLAFWKH
jgi:membrane associated rhomboid family serine protease